MTDERPIPQKDIRSVDGVAVRRAPNWSPERIAAERNGIATGRLREQRDRERARLDGLTTRVSSLLAGQPSFLRRHQRAPTIVHRVASGESSRAESLVSGSDAV